MKPPQKNNYKHKKRIDRGGSSIYIWIEGKLIESHSLLVVSPNKINGAHKDDQLLIIGKHICKSRARCIHICHRQ